MSKSSALIFFWFVFVFYTTPTLFIFMITVTGIKPYEPSVWLVWLWGGGATALAAWIRSSATATPQGQEVAPVPSTDAGEPV